MGAADSWLPRKAATLLAGLVPVHHPWWRVHAGHHLGVLVWLCEGSPDPAQCPEVATSIVHSSPSVCMFMPGVLFCWLVHFVH